MKPVTLTDSAVLVPVSLPDYRHAILHAKDDTPYEFFIYLLEQSLQAQALPAQALLYVQFDALGNERYVWMSWDGTRILPRGLTPVLSKRHIWKIRRIKNGQLKRRPFTYKK